MVSRTVVLKEISYFNVNYRNSNFILTAFAISVELESTVVIFTSYVILHRMISDLCMHPVLKVIVSSFGISLVSHLSLNTVVFFSGDEATFLNIHLGRLGL
jgi:hypothetical protein